MAKNYICSIMIKDGWEIKVMDDNDNEVPLDQVRHWVTRDIYMRKWPIGRPPVKINDKRITIGYNMKACFEIGEKWKVSVLDGAGDPVENVKIELSEVVPQKIPVDDDCFTFMGTRYCIRLP